MDGMKGAARTAALCSVIALCAAAVSAVPSAALAAGQDARVAGAAPDRTTLLVRTRAGADVRALAAGAGGAHAGRVDGTSFHRVNVPAGAAAATLRRLRARRDVVAVQRDHVRSASLAPDDPLFA